MDAVSFTHFPVPSLHQEYTCLHTLHTTHYYLHTHAHAIRYYLSFIAPRVLLFTHTTHYTQYYLHTHSHAICYYLHTHYYLLTPSFYHFLQQMIIVAIVLVAEHDFIEDSVGIAHKLHNFILTFHCSVYHSRYRGHLSEANNKVSIAI